MALIKSKLEIDLQNFQKISQLVCFQGTIKLKIMSICLEP